MYADIVLPLSVEGQYTYAVPTEFEKEIRVGMMVLVPFAGTKRYAALVIRLHNNAPKGFNVKSIDGFADRSVFFSENHIKFLMWVSEYYMSGLGDVLRAALPIAFRLESVIRVSKENNSDAISVSVSPIEQRLLDVLGEGEYLSVTEIQKLLNIKNCLPQVKSLLDKRLISVREDVDPMFKETVVDFLEPLRQFTEADFALIKRAPTQQRVLKYFLDNSISEIRKRDLIKECNVASSALDNLIKNGFLKQVSKICNPLDINTTNATYSPIVLSQPQLEAKLQIETQLQDKDCVLLHGVTASGKTEIYMQLIKQCISNGKCALFLLPEIALTVQIIKRLKLVFGEDVGVYHSGMSDRDRANVWKKQNSDNPYKVMLGVRSSLFLPFHNLGLIVIDEENDPSYKQREPAPRYNGRDAAIMLARIYGAKVLLGSATPSFESYYNATNGKYGYVQLFNRYGNVPMPQIILSDVSEARRKKQMAGSLSPILIDEMRRVLESGSQVILFQNRRGYATSVRCDSCGHTPHCPHCDVSLTYYKQRDTMMCRYCGRFYPVVDKCVVCNDGHYKYGQPGTESIEEEVEKIFPEFKIARMDVDTMNTKAKYRAAISGFESGKTKILIGTQMVSKGLDFAGVKLVGVIDADSIVHFPDFRAEERAFCQLLQVAGRCGRRDGDGKVIIQTSEPNNIIYSRLRNGNYNDMYKALSPERELFGYPPDCRLITIELRNKSEIVLRNEANNFVEYLRTNLRVKGIEGPATPLVGRVLEFYRVHIMLKLASNTNFGAIKKCLSAYIRNSKVQSRLIFDVDTY